MIGRNHSSNALKVTAMTTDKELLESAKSGGHFRIAGHIDDDQQLYWSRVDGWVDRDSADIFQSAPASLPIGTFFLESLYDD